LVEGRQRPADHHAAQTGVSFDPGAGYGSRNGEVHLRCRRPNQSYVTRHDRPIHGLEPKTFGLFLKEGPAASPDPVSVRRRSFATNGTESSHQQANAIKASMRISTVEPKRHSDETLGCSSQFSANHCADG
jgi:hypothetical protein